MEEIKDRIKALRKALGLTQDALADRGGLERVEISNLESGRNQATSVRILKGLAKGLGLDLQATSDFVDGLLSVEDAVAKIQSAGKQPSPTRNLAADLARGIGVSQRAIAEVLAEPMTPEQATWPALWWTDAMRRREIELLPSAAPGLPSKPTPPRALAPSGPPRLSAGRGGRKR